MRGIRKKRDVHATFLYRKRSGKVQSIHTHNDKGYKAVSTAMEEHR